MADVIEAVYENGQIRLLSPVNLIEGQRVHIAIEPLEMQSAVREALGDLVVHWPDASDDSDSHLDQLADELDRAFQGEPPLSQIIIEDRMTRP